MAFSWANGVIGNGTLTTSVGTLTVTGGSEGSPNLLSAGIDTIMLTDNRIGRVISNSSPSTDISALSNPRNFQIKVDMDTQYRAVSINPAGLNTGALIAAAMQTAIQALGGIYAAVTVDYNVSFTNRYVIKSSRTGGVSQVRIAVGSSNDVAATLKISPGAGGYYEDSSAWRFQGYGWLWAVKISVSAGAWLKFDDYFRLEWGGRDSSTRPQYVPAAESSGGANDGGSTILGKGTYIYWRGLGTSTTDSACYAANTGGSFVTQRTNNGQNPIIVCPYGTADEYYTSSTYVRNDFPTLAATLTPNKIDIAGMTIFSGGPSSTPPSHKQYYGTARNFVKASNIFITGGGEAYQTYKTTFTSPQIPYFGAAGTGTYYSIAGDSTQSDVQQSTFNNPVMGVDTVGTDAAGDMKCINPRQECFAFNNPTFPNQQWSGVLDFAGTSTNTWADATNLPLINKFCRVSYDNTITFKQEASALSGIKTSWESTKYSGAYTYDISALTDVEPSYQDTTTGSGQLSKSLIYALQGYIAADSTTYGSAKYSWTCTARAYGYKTSTDPLYSARKYGPDGVGAAVTEEVQMTSVANLAGVNEATAGAYTGISLDGATKTATITVNHSAQELWQYYRYWISQFANFAYADSWDYSAGTLNIYDWNIVANGCTVTGNITTTGNASTSGGGKYTGVIVDVDGTEVPINISTFTSGSRIQIYNVTDASEIYNNTVAATSLSYRLFYTADKTLWVRIIYVSGATAKLPIESTGLLTSTGASFLVTQSDDTVYNNNAIDGSGVTEFSADYPNIQVDINDADNTTTPQRIYAWYQYNLMSSNGIANFFNGMEADDSANYRINQSLVNIKLDNTKVTPLMVVSARLYREDGTTVIAAATNSIQLDPDKAYVAATQAQQIWDYASSSATTVGSIGKQIVDNLDYSITGTITEVEVIVATVPQEVWDYAPGTNPPVNSTRDIINRIDLKTNDV